MENCAADYAVADDVLRMEFGCRPYASWTDQRKLEFTFRLTTMAADRLPARVASARCSWPAVARTGAPAMHAGVVAALERAVDIKVTALAATGMGKVTGEAVRARDVRAMRCQARSTVCYHLRVLGNPARHTNQLQKYLTQQLCRRVNKAHAVRGSFRTRQHYWPQPDERSCTLRDCP